MTRTAVVALATLTTLAGLAALSARVSPGTFLGLARPDRQWSVLRSHPDPGPLIRYQTVNADGQVEERPLPAALPGTTATYSRWVRLPDTVAAGTSLREHAAAYLCRYHGSDRPRGIRFIVLHHLIVGHDQHLHGVRPTHAEALRRETLPEIPCA